MQDCRRDRTSGWWMVALGGVALCLTACTQSTTGGDRSGLRLCAAERCGAPPPADATMCPDGSVAGATGRCLALDDGACTWEVHTCPTPMGDCTEAECGPAPGCPAYMCPE